MTRAIGSVPVARSTEGPVRILHSRRADGDFHLDRPAGELLRSRSRLLDLPWTQPDEVHGTTVLHVDRPGQHDGAEGDALVCGVAGAVLAIWTGDCAPVALVGGGGWFGAVHAGWKGLERGVLGAAVNAVREHSPGEVRAILGPCIHPCCYEFGADDLERLRVRFGPTVVGKTSWGTAALDVPAAVRAALDEEGVTLDDRSECTGCTPGAYYSHRVRADRGRHVMLVWRDGDPGAVSTDRDEASGDER